MRHDAMQRHEIFGLPQLSKCDGQRLCLGAVHSEQATSILGNVLGSRIIRLACWLALCH